MHTLVFSRIIRLMANRKKKNASLGPLFWVAVILLFIIMFLLNRKNILDTFEKTGIFKNQPKETKKTEQVDGAEPAVIDQIKKDTEPLIIVQTEPKQETTKTTITPDQKPNKDVKTEPVKETPSQDKGTKPSQNQSQQTQEKPKQEQTTNQVGNETKAPQVPMRNAKLWFIKIDPEGNVSREEVSRSVPKSDTPLTDDLKELFKGITASEKSKGLRSLIPSGTKLLSATVKNDVAIINVSEEFQFTEYGIEGYLGQLAQIVFTATSYPTVNSVQFLIEGQKKEYLGPEGVWIGGPLSRSKF